MISLNITIAPREDLNCDKDRETDKMSNINEDDWRII